MSESKFVTKKFLKEIIPILLVLTIIISASAVGLFSLLGNNEKESTPTHTESTPAVNNDTPKDVEKVIFNNFKSIALTAGEDFLIDSATPEQAVERSKAVIDSIKNDGFDTVELSLNYKDGLLFETENYSAPFGDLLKELYQYAKRNGIKVITSVDVIALTQNGLNTTEDIDRVCTVLSDSCIGNYSDAVIIKNCYLTRLSESEDTDTLKTQWLEAAEKFYFAVAKADATLYTGFEINEISTPENAVFDYKALVEQNFTDFVTVFNPYSTKSDDISFMTYFEGWRETLGETATVLCKLDYSKLGSGEKGWEQTDQILHQLKALDTLNVTGFTVDGWKEFKNDTTESRDAVKKYLAHLLTDSYILRELAITKPESKTFTTSDKTVLLSGASDPEFKLTLNGEEITRSELGFFSVDLPLQDGLNTFEVQHKGVTETFKITYKRTIIKEISPTKKQTLPSESILLVKCVALSNSKVLAVLGEYEVKLSEEPILDESGKPTGEYSNYSGRITLPPAPDSDLSMGKISFIAYSEYGDETKYGGNIVILKSEETEVSSSQTSTSSTPSSSIVSSSGTSSSGTSTNTSSNNSSSDASSGVTSSNTSSGQASSDSTSSNGTSSGNASSVVTGVPAPTGGTAWVKPANGKYTWVPGTYVAEVINWQAETFSSTDDSDYSRPTNNYLPKGTIDYCSAGDVASSGGNMKILRYGNMIYKTSSKGVATLNVYKGSLPDHNTIGVGGVTNTGRHTLLTLNTLWKAPFRLELKEQKYKNESASNRDYTIESATYSYIDITFCYTTLVAGDVIIPESDPVFKSAEWIKNEGDYTLRLHLKKSGKFYGWSAEYNAEGQLVFSFLNPAKITETDTNIYGHRLDGVVIVIDVGHGGNDVGALGSNKDYPESTLNLILAQKLKAELKAIGATVYMTRYDNNTNPSSDTRMKLLRDVKADYCIAIHRNSSDSSSPRAFNSYHFNAFSSDAAKMIYNATEKADLYQVSKWSGVKWHYFYTARQTDCPVVLTENGFMSNPSEYSDMIRDDFNNECAKALTQGIVDYFKSIQ